MAMLKRLVSILFAPLLIIFLLLGALTLFQDRLLYYPAHVALKDYAADGFNIWPETTQSALSVDEQSPQTPSPGVQHELLGLIAHPKNDQRTAGTAIVFHGNAGHAGHRNYYANQLTKLGLRTILAEYPGYGPRSGKPSEDALIDDGTAIVKRAHQEYGGPIWLVGESLGAGVAAAVVKQVPTIVDGVILITPWNRLLDVAAIHYPFLPLRWLLKSQYNSIEALAGFAGPKLIIVAENDRIVPAELGLDLYKQTNQPKRLVKIVNAGHNDWVTRIKAEFWQTNISWLIDAS